MAIRIFEYGYAHALQNKETKDGVIILPYPRAVVIYLETGGATPDELTVRLIFPDSSEHEFKVKTLKLLDYSVEELSGQGLTPLLPFYVMKLRKAAKSAKTDGEKRRVEQDFKALGVKLKEAIESDIDRGRFTEEDIVTLLERLSGLVGYVGRGYRTMEVKEMLNNSMKGYGQVLLERGERRGRKEGERIGKLEDAKNMLKEGLPIEQAARITGIPADKILKQLNTPQK
ncbi:MAG: hypothetical protein LBD86_06895 [Spirochaetaceae bacterium]|nr:hypothetical protein [Spirochaetaceae bacterium]